MYRECHLSLAAGLQYFQKLQSAPSVRSCPGLLSVRGLKIKLNQLAKADFSLQVSLSTIRPSLRLVHTAIGLMRAWQEREITRSGSSQLIVHTDGRPHATQVTQSYPILSDTERHRTFYPHQFSTVRAAHWSWSVTSMHGTHSPVYALHANYGCNWEQLNHMLCYHLVVLSCYNLVAKGADVCLVYFLMS